MDAKSNDAGPKKSRSKLDLATAMGAVIGVGGIVGREFEHAGMLCGRTSLRQRPAGGAVNPCRRTATAGCIR